MNAKIHPFDFSKLKPGMWIEPDELEEAASCKRDNPNFSRCVQDIRELIELRTGILSRRDGDRLRLMTESEALPWAIRRLQESARGVRRNSDRIASLDHVKLASDAERSVHEHAIRVSSAMAQALSDEERKAKNLFAFAKERALPEHGSDHEMASGDE